MKITRLAAFLNETKKPFGMWVLYQREIHNVVGNGVTRRHQCLLFVSYCEFPLLSAMDAYLYNPPTEIETINLHFIVYLGCNICLKLWWIRNIGRVARHILYHTRMISFRKHGAERVVSIIRIQQICSTVLLWQILKGLK